MSLATGACLCRQITVSIPKEALSTSDNIGIYYCKNCCRVSGSPGSINLIVPESSLKVTGQPKIYQDNNTDSGTIIQRAFCDNCGSPIYTIISSMSSVQVAKLGLFEEIPKPSMAWYCKSMPCWEKRIDGVQQFDTMTTK